MSLKLYKYHVQEVSRIVKLILIYSDCSRIGYWVIFNVLIYLFSTFKDENIIIATTAELDDISDNVIWRKKLHYTAHDYNRERNIQELEANNCNLLKEEIDFAFNETVTTFIKDLKKGTEPTEIRAKIEKNINIDE